MKNHFVSPEMMSFLLSIFIVFVGVIGTVQQHRYESRIQQLEQQLEHAKHACDAAQMRRCDAHLTAGSGDRAR